MNMVTKAKNLLFRPPPKTNKGAFYRVHLSLGYLLGWEEGSHGGASGMPLGVRCDGGVAVKHVTHSEDAVDPAQLEAMCLSSPDSLLSPPLDVLALSLKN